MQSSDGSHQHTAHHSQHRRVCYRYHPFYGHDVEVVRALRRQTEPSVIIRVEGGLQIGIPLWMLEPEHCSTLTDEPVPRIALRALLELRALVDAHPLQQTQRVPSSRPKPRQRGSDEQEHDPSGAPAVTRARPQ